MSPLDLEKKLGKNIQQEPIDHLQNTAKRYKYIFLCKSVKIADFDAATRILLTGQKQSQLLIGCYLKIVSCLLADSSQSPLQNVSNSFFQHHTFLYSV